MNECGVIFVLCFQFILLILAIYAGYSMDIYNFFGILALL